MAKNSANLRIEGGLKLLAKSSVIVLIGVFLSKLFAYVYRVIIARYYGPEVYGLFSLSIMILTFFAAFSSLGLVEGLLRYVSFYRGKNDFNKIKYIFRLSLKITFISSIIAGILLFFSADYLSLHIFNNPNLSIFIKIFSITISISLLLRIFSTILRAFERISEYSFIVNILQSFLMLILLATFLFLGISSNYSIIFSYSIGFLISMIIAYFLCRYKLPIIFEKYFLKKAVKKKIAKELLSYSWPLMFFGIVFSVFLWVDSFVIGFFKGVETVGFYNAVLPIVGLMSIFPELFTQLFFPLVTKEYSKRNMRVIKQLSKQVGKWIFILNIPLFIIVLIFPGAVINILFGEKYLVAETALRILIFGGLTNFSTLLINLLSMAGKTKLILSNLSIAVGVNFLLDILLVPRYGIEGAAVATLITWFLLTLIYLLEVKHYLNFVPLKIKIIRIFSISLVPAFLLVYFKQYIVLNFFNMCLLGVSFVLIYLFLIFITGCLDKNDLVIIRAIRTKLFKIAYLKS